jgi:hypothetical protein
MSARGGTRRGAWLAGGMLLCAWGASPLQGQNVERRFPLVADGSVKVWALAGSVRVNGWARDSVLVRGTVAELSRFHVGASGATVKMFIEDREGGADESHLELWVPTGAKVWVKTESASIEVAGLEGSADLNTIGGAIRVSGSPRDVYAESMDGRIALTVTAPTVRAKTASGDISLEGGGDDFRLTTVSGGIRLDPVKPFERARCESVTGDIRFSGALARGASLELESHSGRIEVLVPAAVDADFDVGTFDGTIDNRLTKARPRELVRQRGRTLSFTSGDGGAQVQVRNFKGTVILRSR